MTGKKEELEAIFTEVEKCAAYHQLNQTATLRLRLLAEEMVEMLPSLLENAEGSFWLENNGKKFELHLSVKANRVDLDARDKLIAISTSGKNAAAVGIMGKIRAAAETMLLASQDVAGLVDFADMDNLDMVASGAYSLQWSLRYYAQNVKKDAENKEAWDELEKSVIANLADDVIVGVKGNQVDIIVCKEFQ